MLRIAPGAARMVLAKMLETRKAVVAYMFSRWALDRDKMVWKGVGLRNGVEDWLIVRIFLTLVNDADAVGKHRKREDYIPLYHKSYYVKVTGSRIQRQWGLALSEHELTDQLRRRL